MKPNDAGIDTASAPFDCVVVGFAAPAWLLAVDVGVGLGVMTTLARDETGTEKINHSNQI